MIDSRTATLALPLALSLLVGCAPTRTTSQTSCVPAPLPGPATANVNLSFTVDLPPSMAKQVDAPMAMKGKLAVSVKSEAIERSPARSRFTGDVDLKITDPLGEKMYVRLLADVGGEYDGPPSKGLVEAIRQVLSALAVPERAIQPAESSIQTDEPKEGR